MARMSLSNPKARIIRIHGMQIIPGTVIKVIIFAAGMPIITVGTGLLYSIFMHRPMWRILPPGFGIPDQSGTDPGGRTPGIHFTGDADIITNIS